MSVRYGLQTPVQLPSSGRNGNRGVHAPAPSCPKDWKDPYPAKALKRRKHPETAADKQALLAAEEKRMRRWDRNLSRSATNRTDA